MKDSSRFSINWNQRKRTRSFGIGLDWGLSYYTVGRRRLGKVPTHPKKKEANLIQGSMIARSARPVDYLDTRSLLSQ